MSNEQGKKAEILKLESELYLLIAKFLSTGPCKGSAELLRKEIEEHDLLPKRVDWLGNEHSRTFDELNKAYYQISDDHLMKICTRIGPILDKEIPPTVSGITSLLGVGRQSLLRTKDDVQKPKWSNANLMARKNGCPHLPSQASQSQYPPNIVQVLLSRETSGALSCQHTFTPKVYARQQNYRRILGHLSSVYCVLFDRTGKYIFTGADDLLVKVWSAYDGRLLAALRGHSAEITDMAVNQENTLIAAGSCDKTIRVWCLRTTAPVAVLCGHTGMVTSLQFCPYPKTTDRLLISTGNDGCVCFWHWNSKTNAFNPKPLKFTERNKPNAQMICSSFSSGGLLLATGSTDHNVRVYNITGLNGPEKILEREVHTDRVDSMQFSNRDLRFISGSKDGTALIWKYERQTWSSIQLKMSTKLPGQSEEADDSKTKLKVNMVGWTLDDSRVITAVSDCTIKVWNSRNGDLCTILKGHEDEVFVLEPHPNDCRIFLSSGHDGRIIIWDLVTGTIIKNHFNSIEGQGHGAVFDCKFSPDGLMFASTDSHGHLSMFGFGSVERYKKVPEEQFFHTDYRPLIRDINHHVLDEQTQTAPHLLPPPFLVDIDGNPYPPNFQRLVPGREHHNDAQLVPYVAVSAEGDSEVFEPVRMPNDDDDRPTIDDMIERLNQEMHLDNESVNGQRPDGAQSPHSSQRSNSVGERNAAEPFSPRTPRSQAGHSRVGLRRTGDVEGVQSVGNWQSRGNQPDSSLSKRVVVKPMPRSLSIALSKKRLALAENEMSIFNLEKKRRPPLPEIHQDKSTSKEEGRFKKQTGLRAGLRSGAQEEDNSTRDDAEGTSNSNQGNSNTLSSSDSETDQEESYQSNESDTGDYSDWMEKEPKRESKRNQEVRQAPACERPRRKVRSRRYKDSGESGEESEDDLGEGTSNGTSRKRRKPKPKQSTPATKKKVAATNGSALQRSQHPPPEWLTDIMPNKAPYFPQIGDEVMYFRQGHESYVQAVKRNRTYEILTRNQPWRKINLRDQEVARIDDISYINNPPILCCLQLTLLNPASKNADKFTVMYHDMPDVIDFIILKQSYDQAMCYDWKIGDRFRSAIDKVWWLGTIKAHKPLNPEFPDSMFQCFLVKWDNGEKEHMSPWDFEPIDNERLPEEEGGSVDILPEERVAMMYVPEPLEWSHFGRDHDCDRIARGLSRIMELSIADNFTDPVDLNQYPSYSMYVEYPMDFRTIKARVQNKFYRRLESLKFDVKYIEINAAKFNKQGSQIIKKAKCVVDLCLRFIDSPYCSDPMILYHDMMEAKQSRSQDSQSELDVLCSESDSDGEHGTSSRIKRKKRNALQQSNKRLRLEDKKYTSNSWKQQCETLLNTFFQCEDSTPFRYPVSLNEYPDYRNIIDHPMDLSTVREKMSSGSYNNPAEFCKDMRMIFQNSRNYNINKKSRIYSMTIRLSAMFEEHIRGIISDWRSAVKYEEKIRNNQFVSQRRQPLPVLEGGLNVGASTSSVFASSSSSRLDSSRLSSSHSSAFSTAGSSRSHHNKISNGTVPKKKIKHEPSSPPQSRASSLRFKGKIPKPRLESLSNGVERRTIIGRMKRKIPDRLPRKASERIRKQEHSYAEFSHSDSNCSNNSNSSEENSGSSEMNMRPKSKRRRKSSDIHVQKTTIRTRVIKKTQISTRSSSYHPKSSRAHSKSLNAQDSRSPSPESSWPHKRRSHEPQICTLIRPRRQIRKPQAYRGDSSDSDENSRARQVATNNVSHHGRNTRPRKPVSYRLLNSGESFDSEDSDSRVVAKSKRGKAPLRSTRHMSSRQKSPTPEQEEGNSEEEQSESGSESQSFPSEQNSNSSNSSKSKTTTTTGGSSKSQPFSSSEEEEEDSEPRPRRTTRLAPRASALSGKQSPRKSGRIATRYRGQRRVQYQEGNSDEDSDNEESSRSYNSRGFIRSHNDEATEKPARVVESFKGKASSSSGERPQLLFRRCLKTSSSNNNTSYILKTTCNHASSLKLQSPKKKTVYRKLVCQPKIEGLNSLNKKKFRVSYTKSIKKASGAFAARKNPDLIKKYMFRRRSMIKKPLTTGSQSGRIITFKKNNPISLNTRSKLYMGLIDMKHLSEKTNERARHKPTIVFCKPSSSNDYNEMNSQEKNKLKSVANSNEKSKNSEESMLTTNVDAISSHTRSSSPKSDASLFDHNNPGATRKCVINTSKTKSSDDSLFHEDTSQEKCRPSTSAKVSFSQPKTIDQNQVNQRKWCLRNAFRSSKNSSTNPSSCDIELSKVQTRNRGQRTVGYYEDSDNNYLTEILENEDPIKAKQKNSSLEKNSEGSRENSNTLHKTNCNDTYSDCDSSTKSNTAVILRPKKEALKNLPNGMETRNHGQRTTVYNEDGDDYLEEYFEIME